LDGQKIKKVLTMSANLNRIDGLEFSIDNSDHRRRKQPRGEFADAYEEAPHRANLTLRTIVPTLVVALGGAGGQMASWVKKHLENQGTDSYARFVAIDTDESAQAGADGCPSFSDEEFVHVNTSRVGNIIQNPKLHRTIVDRAGLDEGEKLAFHQRLLNEGIEQAGQVRSFGNMAMLSNFAMVQSALRSAIAHLNGTYSDLEKQLQSENRVLVRRHMTVYVLFSNAGGTGSSMATETMALLRKLTAQLSVEIVGVMVMPSAFDSVMTGRPDQELRIRANALATMQELNAFREGFGTSHGIKLGPDERNEMTVPAGLFNQLFAVGRYMADGRDLRTQDAVIHSAALNLAAEIGTEIADRIEADDANQATLRGLTPDPMSGKSRYLSTFGATALALPVERMARSAAASSVDEFLRERVLGRESSAAVFDRCAETWVAQPLEGEPLELKAASLAGLLRRHVLPNPAVLTRGLYRVVSGTQRVHFRNSQFTQHFGQLRQHFQESLLPGYELRLTEYTNELIGELITAFAKHVSKLGRDLGWRTAEGFCQSLDGVFAKASEVLTLESDRDYELAKASFSKAQESVTTISSFWRSLGTSRKRQSFGAERLQTAMVAAVEGVAKLQAQRVFNALRGEIATHRKGAERVVQGAERCLNLAQAAYDDARAGRRLTTNSQAEIDVSTPATDRELFQKHRPDNAAILDRFSAFLKMPPSKALTSLVTDPAVFEALLENLRSHFLDRFASVSVVDVLAEQLADPATEQNAMARIRQAVLGCQPLWRAESGQIGVEFADTMIIGIPESSVTVKRDRVAKALMDAATHRIHPNGQYNGSASQVTSGDAHRIYVIRRTHGACLHYLPEVKECQSAVDQWNRSGGHPVHIFNTGIVANMPGIIPNSDVDDGELAFALGLAYGWIANRGPHWYWNLAVDSGNNGRLVSRLKSHWDGVAFQNQRLALQKGALETFVGTGRLTYEERDDMVSSDKLGQGMDKALQAVCNNGEMIELIIDSVDEMRAAAGDVPVAAELEAYVGVVKKRTRSSDQNYDLIMGMVGMLLQQLTSWRRG
jgi:hypothetical protein